ncbi:MAG: DNA translocase FtsK 4TM domain-containing protein [Mariprofundaceae bacterium]|nr:DNA translocase FtsK 4TM domain-containing protein [Mariprofundaceae bacterium]
MQRFRLSRVIPFSILSLWLIVLTLSLFSYSAVEKPSNLAQEAAQITETSTSNWIESIGYEIADVLFQAFGATTWLWLLLGIAWLWRIRPTQSQTKVIYLADLCWALVILIFSCFCTLYGSKGSGGIIGEWLALPLENTLSHFITVLLLLLTLWSSLTLALRHSLVPLFISTTKKCQQHIKAITAASKKHFQRIKKALQQRQAKIQQKKAWQQENLEQDFPFDDMPLPPKPDSTISNEENETARLTNPEQNTVDVKTDELLTKETSDSTSNFSATEPQPIKDALEDSLKDLSQESHKLEKTNKEESSTYFDRDDDEYREQRADAFNQPWYMHEEQRIETLVDQFSASQTSNLDLNEEIAQKNNQTMLDTEDKTTPEFASGSTIETPQNLEVDTSSFSDQFDDKTAHIKTDNTGAPTFIDQFDDKTAQVESDPVETPSFTDQFDDKKAQADSDPVVTASFSDQFDAKTTQAESDVAVMQSFSDQFDDKEPPIEIDVFDMQSVDHKTSPVEIDAVDIQSFTDQFDDKAPQVEIDAVDMQSFTDQFDDKAPQVEMDAVDMQNFADQFDDKAPQVEMDAVDMQNFTDQFDDKAPQVEMDAVDMQSFADQFDDKTPHVEMDAVDMQSFTDQSDDKAPMIDHSEIDALTQQLNESHQDHTKDGIEDMQLQNIQEKDTKISLNIVDEMSAQIMASMDEMGIDEKDQESHQKIDDASIIFDFDTPNSTQTQHTKTVSNDNEEAPQQDSRQHQEPAVSNHHLVVQPQEKYDAPIMISLDADDDFDINDQDTKNTTEKKEVEINQSIELSLDDINHILPSIDDLPDLSLQNMSNDLTDTMIYEMVSEVSKSVSPELIIDEPKVESEEAIWEDIAEENVEETSPENEVKEDITPPKDAFELPSLQLFKNIQAPKDTDKIDRDDRERLEEVLLQYKIKGTVIDVKLGPVVTQYIFKPEAGVKINSLINVQADLARGMGALSVRVAGNIHERQAIGIEIPNSHRETVLLKTVLRSEQFQENKGELPLAVGVDISGQPVVFDLVKTPHLLVAGTTGSGKSVAINTMICSLLMAHSPKYLKLILIDPKMLELSMYADIPHLLVPVVTEPNKASRALAWAVLEMDRRYQIMAEFKVRNIDSYNQVVKATGSKHEHFPYIVIVIDELADLMMISGKEVEQSICRIAQKARAAGIHLIVATQRPSVDVITGLIKANLPSRLSFKVSSKIDSRTVLDQMGAEQLLGYGDSLFMFSGTELVRIHGAFVTDKEVSDIADHWRAQEGPQYHAAILDHADQTDSEGIEYDERFDEAVALVVEKKQCSASMIQRHLRIGYNRASRIVEAMESNGIVSAPGSGGIRQVMAPDQSEKH